MVRRWILYGLMVLSAIVFQIIYIAYFAQFVLLVVLCVPVLSLLLSLPGWRGLRLSMEAGVLRQKRGVSSRWIVNVQNRSGFPVSQLQIQVSIQNRLTGQIRQQTLRASGLSAGAQLLVDEPAAHCGLLVCKVERVRAYDLFGLFPLSVQRPSEVQMEIVPRGEKEKIHLPARLLQRKVVRPGGVDDTQDLREYHPGDPLRSIHWKLSTKRDWLIVREMWQTAYLPVVLQVDARGTPEQLDRRLDRLEALGYALLQREIPFRVCWTLPDGGVRHWSVQEMSDWKQCLSALLRGQWVSVGACTRPEPGKQDVVLRVREEEQT